MNVRSTHLEFGENISNSRRPADCEFYAAPLGLSLVGLSLVFKVPVADATG